MNLWQKCSFSTELNNPFSRRVDSFILNMGMFYSYGLVTGERRGENFNPHFSHFYSTHLCHAKLSLPVSSCPQSSCLLSLHPAPSSSLSVFPLSMSSASASGLQPLYISPSLSISSLSSSVPVLTLTLRHNQTGQKSQFDSC